MRPHVWRIANTGKGLMSKGVAIETVDGGSTTETSVQGVKEGNTGRGPYDYADE